MRNKILIKRGYIESLLSQKDKKESAYFQAKLLNEFGVMVDKPELLTVDNLKFISNYFGKDIPYGFYENPQHTKYFSCDELIIEQLVSYIQIGINGADSLNEKVFERNEVFKKVLPEYMVGDEIKLRKFKIITQEEADCIFQQITHDFCLYTRPWSVDELVEFKWLYLNGYYCDDNILCKDNAISMFLSFKDVQFASMLDKKDIVKMSLYKFGEKKILDFSDEDKILFSLAIGVAKDCPLSLKQSKYYNRILKNIDSDLPLENNNNSVYKKAINLFKNGKILESAKVFSNNGSMLERNLLFLLSRASFDEAEAIIDLIKSDNPIVLIQLALGVINNECNKKRIFNFTFNNKLKTHVETDYEFNNRKSNLSVGMKNFVLEKINQKIKQYYSKKSLGKIYLNPELKKVALPLNTSTMGMGMDVLPTGSRLPIKYDYLRTFCYWNKVFDIDTSVIFINEDGESKVSYWGNFAKKQFGNSCLCSGDDRGKDGAEFYDFKISELKNMKFRYAIYTLNGYAGNLNQGEIYCGLQNKKNLNTLAFVPKNIEFKIHVKGDSRAYIGFAIDFNTNEIIILNTMLLSSSRVVSQSNINSVKQLLNNTFLQYFSLYNILSYMGEVVEDKNIADIIFDYSRESKDGKEVISPYDIEKIVKLLK